MADREQDHPSQRGAKGFFKRSISGDNSFYKDYAREVRAELNTVPRGELPFAWTMQTILGGGMLAIPGAAISAFAVFCFMNEKAPVDGGLHAVAEAGPGYQAVRFNDGQAFVLVTQNGHMSVFRQTDGNELTLIESAAQAMEAIEKVRSTLAGSVAAIENRQLAGADLPEFLTLDGLSQAYRDEDGRIERRFAAATTAQGQNDNLLASLRAAQAHWSAAGETAASARYGYDGAEKAALFQQADPGDKVFAGGVAFAALGALLGFTGPFTVALPRTLRRRRQMKKG